MKRILTLALILFPLLAAGQQSILDVNDVDYRGVDFTKTMILAANESDAAFVKIFTGINNLVITESNKYDLGKAFRKNVFVKDLTNVHERNSDISGNMRTNDANYMINGKELQEIVDAYKADTDGVGLIIVGELLNKSASKGRYVVVFFDSESGDIIYTKRVTGKAGGFGLRNFWAASLHNVLKKWRY